MCQQDISLKFSDVEESLRNKLNKETLLKANIARTLYKASIEDENLEIFFVAVWTRAGLIQDITKLQWRQCLEDGFIRKANGQQVYVVDQAIKKVVVQMHITDAEDRVLTLQKEYCQAL